MIHAKSIAVERPCIMRTMEDLIDLLPTAQESILA